MSSTRIYESSTSGLNFDRFVDRFDDSTLTKVQARFWTAKQAIRKKLGKKEDEYLLASDAEFDAKINLFKALKATSEQMFVCVDDYQHYLGELTQTEVNLGQMLSEKSREEIGDTGKALAAVGKVQSLSATYRQKFRAPLIRFMEELRVFTNRAIFDCSTTVEAAEKARTEYRGSLLWMKKTSNELDPEAENALEKFRKTQNVVRRNKEKLDVLKMDTLQKVDLLSASRCNLFAQLLGNYQKCLYEFYEQTALAYARILGLVNSCKKYQFEILKDLSEPLEKVNETAEAESKKTVADASLVNLGEEDLLHESTSLEINTAEAEIIDEDNRTPLGISLEREESPLGEDDSSPDVVKDQKPKIPIGPLPKSKTLEEEIPKLSPPPGWVAPNSDSKYVKDLVDLLAQNDSATTAESFASEWSKLFEDTRNDRLSEAPVSSISNLPSQLLDTSNITTTHFPNPFEEPLFEDWNKYLVELDLSNSGAEKSC